MIHKPQKIYYSFSFQAQIPDSQESFHFTCYPEGLSMKWSVTCHWSESEWNISHGLSWWWSITFMVIYTNIDTRQHQHNNFISWNIIHKRNINLVMLNCDCDYVSKQNLDGFIWLLTTHTNKTLTDSTQVAELYSLCGNYTYIYITLKWSFDVWTTWCLFKKPSWF